MQISEFDCLLSGLGGGILGGFMCMGVIAAHLRFLFNERIKSMQLQLIAMRAELNSQYEHE